MLPYYNCNVFFWWPDKDGKSPDPKTIKSDLRTFTIDPKSDDMKLEPGKFLAAGELEFPRIDDRYQMARHSKTFFCTFKPEMINWPVVGPKMGGGYPPYNGVGCYDSNTGKVENYFAGPSNFTQESVFVPRDENAPEGDGWLM